VTAAKGHLKAVARAIVARFVPAFFRGMVLGNLEVGIDALTNKELVAILNDLDAAVTAADAALGRRP